MNLVVSVPSKTFLIGEYAVLHGGPALLISHQPRFQLHVDTSGGQQGQCEGISLEGPGGQWIRRQANLYKNVGLFFKDPHRGRGGFGASSAQFVLSYAWSQLQNFRFSDLHHQIQTHELWKSFKSLDFGCGQMPSGADVVSQLLGGVTCFAQHPWRAQSSPWPFANLDFLLVPTGFKVKTHEHLRERLPVSDDLLKISCLSEKAFHEKDETKFISEVRRFGEELERLQLVTSEVRGLIASLGAHSGILAVKGCGALGADVLLVLLRSEHKNEVSSWLSKMGWPPLANRDQIEEGLKIEVKLEARHEISKGLLV